MQQQETRAQRTLMYMRGVGFYATDLFQDNLVVPQGTIQGEQFVMLSVPDNDFNPSFTPTAIDWTAGLTVDLDTQFPIGLMTAGVNYGYDVVANDFLVITTRALTDAESDANVQGLDVRAFGMGYNGATSDRLRTQSITNAALAQQIGVVLATTPAQWTETDIPAANTAAAAVHAAGGAGTQHIVKQITVSLAAGAAASGIVTATLTDGVNTLWTGKMSAPINGSVSITPPGLEIPIPANTAATLNVTAGGANTEVTAAMSGYTI